MSRHDVLGSLEVEDLQTNFKTLEDSLGNIFYLFFYCCFV